MPVRWTAENDQVLLLKIIETTSISLDYKAIAAAWPQGGERPTHRAISEHIFKLKGMHKDTTGANGTPTQSPAKKNTTTKSATSTPKKRGRKPANDVLLSTESSQDEAPTSAKKKRARSSTVVVKPEPNSEQSYPFSPAATNSGNMTTVDEDYEENPNKRLKRSYTFASTFNGKDENDEGDEDAEYDFNSSIFA